MLVSLFNRYYHYFRIIVFSLNIFFIDNWIKSRETKLFDFVDFYWDSDRKFKQCFRFNMRSYICKLNSDYYRFSIVWPSLINVSWRGQDFINWTFAYFISGECNDQLQSKCHLPICKWNHKRVYPKMGICGKCNIYKQFYNLIYISLSHFLPFNFALEEYFPNYIWIFNYIPLHIIW